MAVRLITGSMENRYLNPNSNKTGLGKPFVNHSKKEIEAVKNTRFNEEERKRKIRMTRARMKYILAWVHSKSYFPRMPLKREPSLIFESFEEAVIAGLSSACSFFVLDMKAKQIVHTEYL